MSGFLMLLFIPLEFFTSIAVGGMLVVACVSLATLTLLPATIFLVGAGLEWGSGWLAPLTRLRHEGAASSSSDGATSWSRRSKLCVGCGLLVLRFWPCRSVGLKIASVEAKNIPLAIGVAPRLREPLAKSRRGLDDAGHCARAAFQRRLDDVDGLAFGEKAHREALRSGEIPEHR
jgi:hypothetical protein